MLELFDDDSLFQAVESDLEQLFISLGLNHVYLLRNKILVSFLIETMSSKHHQNIFLESKLSFELSSFDNLLYQHSLSQQVYELRLASLDSLHCEMVNYLKSIGHLHESREDFSDGPPVILVLKDLKEAFESISIVSL